MNFISLNEENSLFIFGRLPLSGATNLLKDLKARRPEYKYTYVSVTVPEGAAEIVVSTVADNSRVISVNSTFKDFIDHLSKELHLIIANQSEYDSNFNVTIIICAFAELSTEVQEELLNAKFSSTIPDLSRQTFQLGRQEFNDIELFHCSSIQDFDDFITRMSNFESDSLNDLVVSTKFYSRFWQ